MVVEVGESRVHRGGRPDVAFLYALPPGALDQDVMVGLVCRYVAVLLDGGPQRLVKTLEKRLGLGQQPVGGALVHVETVLVEVLHDTLDRHGVHVAQVRQPGYEGAVIVGVEKRSVRRLPLHDDAPLGELVDTVDDAEESHGDKLVTHHVPGGELARQ